MHFKIGAYLISLSPLSRGERDTRRARTVGLCLHPASHMATGSSATRNDPDRYEKFAPSPFGFAPTTRFLAPPVLRRARRHDDLSQSPAHGAPRAICACLEERRGGGGGG